MLSRVSPMAIIAANREIELVQSDVIWTPSATSQKYKQKFAKKYA